MATNNLPRLGVSIPALPLRTPTFSEIVEINADGNLHLKNEKDREWFPFMKLTWAASLRHTQEIEKANPKRRKMEESSKTPNKKKSMLPSAATEEHVAALAQGFEGSTQVPIISKKTMLPSAATEERVAALAQRFEGSTPVWIVSKTVTASDVNPNQNRLLISDKKGKVVRALRALLSGDEMAHVMDDENGLLVTVVDGAGNVYCKDEEGGKCMKLRFLSSNNGVRVIGTNYRQFVQKNALRAEAHAVHVWGFHVKHSVSGKQDVWLAMLKEDMKAVRYEELAIESDAAEAVEVPTLAATAVLSGCAVKGRRGRKGVHDQ